MNKQEAQSFLLDLSKEIDPINEIQICMENIFTKQLIKFNTLLSALLIGAFFIDVFSYGALIGIIIITITMYCRIKNKKPKYLKEMKKLVKTVDISLLNNSGNETTEIFKLVGNRFLIENLITEISECISNRAKNHLSDHRFQLTYNEFKLYFETIDKSGEKKDLYYRSLKEEFEKSKEKLLANSYNNF